MLPDERRMKHSGFFRRPAALALGTALVLGLDLVFFSNCNIPGNTQSPQVLGKGKSDLGISGHTGAILFPIEGGLYYRRGIGRGMDVGIRAHNWMDLAGALLDLRKSLGGGPAVLSMATGYYRSGDQYLQYFGPSIFGSNTWGFMGGKINGVLGNWGVGEYGAGLRTGYRGAFGASHFAGFRVGKKVHFSGSYEVGFYNTDFSESSEESLPILQLELGLGFYF